MNLPNDFHLTGDEDTITIEINSRLMPITPEMRHSPPKPRYRGDLAEPYPPRPTSHDPAKDSPAEPQ